MAGRLLSAVSFALGICLVCWQVVLLPQPLIAALFVLGVGVRLALKASFLSWLVLGLVWANFHAHQVIAERIPGDWLERQIEVVGLVSGPPVQGSGFTRFDFEIRSLEGQEKVVGGARLVRLRWYGDVEPLLSGQLWRLSVKLSRPRGYRNGYGFDYERFLFFRGITATGYVIGGDRAFLSNPIKDSLWVMIRERFTDRIARLSDRLQYPDLMIALALGDRSGISPERWTMLRRSGLSHLVAISGLHVGLAALMGALAGGWFASLSPFVLRVIPRRFIALAGGMLTGFAYASLAGFPVSTMRAFCMLLIGAGAVIALRRVTLDTVLTLALVTVVALDPFAVLSPGFWMSFVAVWLIGLALSRNKNSEATRRSRRPSTQRRLLEKARTFVITLVRVQIFLFFGMSPLVAFFFQEVSLSAPIVNFLAVPLISVAVVPLILSSLGLDLLTDSIWVDYLLIASDRFLSMPMLISEFFANIRWTFVSIDSFSGAGLTAVAGVLAFFYARKKREGSLILILACLWALGSLSIQDDLRRGEFKLTVLDVGQGLSVVVETERHIVFYDLGPGRSRFAPAAESLKKILRDRDRRGADVVILSHRAQDHVGGRVGLKGVLEQTGRIFDSDQEFSGDPCDRSISWEADRVAFRFLNAADQKFTSANDRSCVLLITGSFGSALLTGDIESAAERALVAHFGTDLKVDVLQAPHHGSKTSSTHAFLKHTSPTFALISRGARNKFGHPHGIVIKRYLRRGITILDTAILGRIALWSRAEGWTQRSFAEKRQRFWHWKMVDGQSRS